MSKCNEFINKSGFMITMKQILSQYGKVLEDREKKNAIIPGKLSCITLKIHLD